NGTLVMLGPPGSGKTISLLLLAQALVERAEDRKRSGALGTSPIPVVFNLSSWQSQHESFFQWLQSELREKYFVPEPMGRRLLGKNRILPLLDGLDEVGAGHRVSCVRAINDFIRRPSNSPTQVLVSCRLEEYTNLPESLRFKELKLEAL